LDVYLPVLLIIIIQLLTIFFPSVTHLIWFSEFLARTAVDRYSSRLKGLGEFFTVWKTSLLLPFFALSSSSSHSDSSSARLSLRSIFCTSLLSLLYSVEDCAFAVRFLSMSWKVSLHGDPAFALFTG